MAGNTITKLTGRSARQSHPDHHTPPYTPTFSNHVSFLLRQRGLAHRPCPVQRQACHASVEGGEEGGQGDCQQGVPAHSWRSITQQDAASKLSACPLHLQQHQHQQQPQQSSAVINQPQ